MPSSIMTLVAQPAAPTRDIAATSGSERIRRPLEQPSCRARSHAHDLSPTWQLARMGSLTSLDTAEPRCTRSPGVWGRLHRCPKSASLLVSWAQRFYHHVDGRDASGPPRERERALVREHARPV